jgi:AcrR family transcriptional regulator
MGGQTRSVNPRPYHHGDLRRALIEAGIAILTEQGMAGLTLRKVASRAGVSHAAPYSHFTDKQALLAAIGTQGYHTLHERLCAAIQGHEADPWAELEEAAWAYVGFALEKPAHFRVTLSGLVERQSDHPEYVEIAHRSFDLVLRIVGGCQAAGHLGPGPVAQVAAAVWALVHGMASLLLEGQLPHTVTEAAPARKLLLDALGRMGTSPGLKRAPVKT